MSRPTAPDGRECRECTDRRPPRIGWIEAGYRRVAGGALVTGWIAPLVAGFTTSAVFLGWHPTFGWHPFGDHPDAVEAGIAAGVVVWALAAILLWPVVATRWADSESWYLASARFQQLSARLDDLDTRCCGHSPALNEARRAVDSVCSCRFVGPGVHWATHLGYIALWRALHVGEAALILSMSRDDLWQTLQWVRLRLDGASTEVSSRLKAVVDDVAGYLAANPVLDCRQDGARQPAPHCAPTDLGLPAVTSEGDARRRLRQVVAALNDFVDEKYAGLVRLRNHILAALGLTELFAFVLLALAVRWLTMGEVATCLLYFVVAGRRRLHRPPDQSRLEDRSGGRLRPRAGPPADRAGRLRPCRPGRGAADGPAGQHGIHFAGHREQRPRESRWQPSPTSSTRSA